MKHYKKVFALVLIVLVILSLVSCGQKAEEGASGTSNSSQSTETSGALEQPFHIIVPFKAGASADTMVRGLQVYLAEELGVPVVIENYEGGAYTIGTTHAYRQAADGYTALLVSDPYISGALTQMTDVCPNGWDDWAALGAFNLDQGAIMANTNNYTSMEDVLTDLKNGEKVTFANSQGALGGIGFMSLCDALDIPYPEFVWYTGGSEVRSDSLGGFVDTNTALHDGYYSLHEAGQVKFLTLFSDERYDDCADVPTAKEVVEAMGGNPDEINSLSALRGLMVHADVAKNYPERYQFIIDALERAVTNPEYVEWAKGAGFTVTYLDEVETRAKLDELGGYIEMYPDGFFGTDG